MTPEIIIDLSRQAMELVIILVSILVIPGLVVGLFISVMQAATQINEQTLTTIPRLVVTFMSLIVMGPWILGKLTDFTTNVLESVGGFVS